jgi:hypothetical protein
MVAPYSGGHILARATDEVIAQAKEKLMADKVFLSCSTASRFLYMSMIKAHADHSAGGRGPRELSAILEHVAPKAAKNKSKKKTSASFFCRKNKNTGRQVLQNKGPNRAYSR